MRKVKNNINQVLAMAVLCLSLLLILTQGAAAEASAAQAAYQPLTFELYRDAEDMNKPSGELVILLGGVAIYRLGEEDSAMMRDLMGRIEYNTLHLFLLNTLSFVNTERREWPNPEVEIVDGTFKYMLKVYIESVTGDGEPGSAPTKDINDIAERAFIPPDK